MSFTVSLPIRLVFVFINTPSLSPPFVGSLPPRVDSAFFSSYSDSSLNLHLRREGRVSRHVRLSVSGRSHPTKTGLPLPSSPRTSCKSGLIPSTIWSPKSDNPSVIRPTRPYPHQKAHTTTSKLFRNSSLKTTKPMIYFGRSRQ